MVTALHDSHGRVQGINASADDFLTKPIDETALSARIKSFTRLKMVIDELRLRGETNAEIGGVAGSSIMDYSNQIFDTNKLFADEDVFQAEQIYNVLSQRFASIKVLNAISETDGLRLGSEFRSKVETHYTAILILSEDYDKTI